MRREQGGRPPLNPRGGADNTRAPARCAASQPLANPCPRSRLIPMQSRLVGSTGLRVSRLGLGTMTWGRDTTPEQARGLLQTFCEAGGTLIDTAAAYGAGDA